MCDYMRGKLLSQCDRASRIAIASLLFNWPSYGGGNVHTISLAQRLTEAGFSVCHFFADFPPWQIGSVDNSCPFPSESLSFSDREWNAASIRERFRRAINHARPDYVLITDSWNSKPLLAEAAAGHPFVLRMDAQECLCPLNNIRLRPSRNGELSQCSRNFAGTPRECVECVRANEMVSGPLHALERELSWSVEHYHARLLWSLRAAYAVLAVNPSIAAMVEPYASNVYTVPGGIDPEEFSGGPMTRNESPVHILFLGNLEDPLKGFEVLHRACALLWQVRKDFRLLCAAEPIGILDAFTERIGWHPRSSLSSLFQQVDVVAVPSVCQDAMPLVALEAMAAARPVVASRIGGLQYSVADGLTGLLCIPGDANDLARKVAMLLDDEPRRNSMGAAGRRRIEERYAWDVLIRKHYLPLFGRPNLNDLGADDERLHDLSALPERSL